jgi:Flp pilus assembly protein TadD
MKRINAAVPCLLALGLLALTGCADSPIHLDPLATDGRDGGGKPASYETLMRIGAAAHAAGDLATAVGIYRRAASIDTHAVAPFVAAGNTLAEMGKVDEAVVAYNSALARNGSDPEALRGLARTYLMSGKPELAGRVLSVAYKAAPNDPKLLELIGVTDDFAGQHEEAQARYRRALELLPGDAGISLDLGLSLALTGDYNAAVAVLRPIAMGITASPRERQTLALIYGLAGDRSAAEQTARLDLNTQAVQRNLQFYETLRRLSPDARARAIQSLSTHSGFGGAS